MYFTATIGIRAEHARVTKKTFLGGAVLGARICSTGSVFYSYAREYNEWIGTQVTTMNERIRISQLC
jgi:hypothetical protein